MSPAVIRARLPRIASRLLRTSRYIAELLVWSRVFAARRTEANIEITPGLLADKGVAHHQPQFEISGRTGAEHFAHGFAVIYDVLFANLRKADRLLDVRHALPGPSFAGVYLWDSAFIAQIWRHWDRAVAYDVLESVIQLRDGDRLQHFVSDFARSPFTQPPLIAWSAMRIWAEDGGTRGPTFVRQHFAQLKAYNRWLNDNRRLENGLYFWAHPYESGVENAPRFSSRDEKRLADTRPMAAPDLSAYMVLQCEALTQMAQSIGDSISAVHFSAEARRTRELVNAHLWHEQDGLYYDRNGQNGEFIRSRTIASLIPLAAGIPDEPRARRLRHLACSASAFGSPIPLPSVALDDPDFCRDMWRGPVWINTAYLVLDGLRRYGYLAEYGELAWRLCDGVFRVLMEEHQVYEFYDPENFHTRELHRKKGNLWKLITLGNSPQKDFVGWTGLVNTLMIEGLFGLGFSKSFVRMRPAFPPAAAGLTFRLHLRQSDCSVRLAVGSNKRYSGELRLDGQTRDFDLALGEAIELART